MAKYFSSKFQPEITISSPMTRTKQTTEHIQFFCQTEVVYDERLREWNNGVLAGLSRQEAMDKYPMPPHRPVTEAIEEGESELSFRHRIEEAIYESSLEKY